MLSQSHEPVRLSAAQYFAAVPDSSAVPALEKALASEPKAAVKKQLKRALRAAKKMA